MNTSSMARGMIPLLGPEWAPSIVKVLPVPVCPYAMIAALYPCSRRARYTAWNPCTVGGQYIETLLQDPQVLLPASIWSTSALLRF